MEEDIKILEEFLTKTDVDYAEYFNCTKSLIPDTVEIAIKNILSSYKQLEEENKIYKEELNKIDKALNLEEGTLAPNRNIIIESLKKGIEQLNKKINEYEKTLKKLQKETIWKSKVKEKIEEYKMLFNEIEEKLPKICEPPSRLVNKQIEIKNKIQILEDLLGKE